jgi:hypothetical protein
MAWRIDESVRSGEIDNRERGVVRGKIWLHGLKEPVVLELKGNACPDLAGCLLRFENPGETVPLRIDARMEPLQRGTIGDLTASRKVRVFDIPFEEACERLKNKLPVPEHMANCLYLEWFSEFNGRVVIESADYQLTISPPAWTLSTEEEQRRQRDAAEGFSGFMQKLSQALEAARHEPGEDKEWDEFDYEKLIRESDARTDKYLELLDKYQDAPDQDRLIAREMGWLDEEEGGDGGELAAGTAADKTDAPTDDDSDTDEINRICAEAVENPMPPDPLTEGVDWVRTEDGEIRHPLSLRAFDSSMALWHKCDELGLSETEDDDLCKLVAEFQITGAKLAGALDGLAYDRGSREGPFVVAYLKRALGHLHAAQSALEKVAPKNLLPADALDSTRAELFGIREEILRLMKEFRGQK